MPGEGPHPRGARRDEGTPDRRQPQSSGLHPAAVRIGGSRVGGRDHRDQRNRSGCGSRTKIAVVSNDNNVDPVGACVGARGSRVRQVVNELRGEKVDIVPWRDDTKTFISEALSPARVRQVILDEKNAEAIVVVPDHQLSLAIGKEGQNARLAARLSGYRIDIRSETGAGCRGRRGD